MNGPVLQTPDMVRTTLPHLLRYRAATLVDKVAMREKVRGIWVRTSWREYEDRVINFALGLAALGFKRGDRLAIAAEDTPEWIIADMAAQALGGVSVGIYPTNAWPEIQYIVRHSRCRFVVCGDQEQTDKLLTACTDEGGLPLVEKLICVDMKGMRHYADMRILSFAEVSQGGNQKRADEKSAWWREALAKIGPDDIGIIVYTSGTTGPPKGAQLRHCNLLHSADALATTYGLHAGNYSVLCYLPLCHVGERICSMTLHLRTGGVVNFSESIDTVQQNIAEISPSFFLGMPRIWEKHRLSALIKLKEASWVQRRLFETIFKRAYAKLAQEDLVNQSGAPRQRSVWSRLENWGYWLLVFRSVIRHMGLDHSIVRICGGSSVSPETLRFFEALGLPVYQVYGLTESGGITFAQHALVRKPGCAGPPIPGIEYRVAADGEILIKGPTVFAGYLYDEESTARTLDADGWLSTGDVVEQSNNGEIRIVDRKKAIIITSGGKNIAPSELENALKESPYIREAIILGEARHFVAALIQVDPEVVGKWAQEQRLPYTNYRSLAALEQVRKLVSTEVDRVNGRFARVENIRKFVILGKELDQDDGELTATQKVKRAAIEKKYANEIAQIYGEKYGEAVT
jgi:long-chain acyl-CoA synthetase